MFVDRWVDEENVVYLYNEVLFSHEKNEIMPFAVVWMDLEIIIPREVNQRKANIIWYHLRVESKRMIQLHLFTDQK